MSETTQQFLPVVGQFDKDTLFRDTAEESLYGEYMHGFRSTLGDALLGESFSAEAVPGLLHVAIDDLTPSVINRTLAKESRFHGGDRRHLTQALGTLGLLDEQVVTQQPPRYFVEDLHQQIDALPYDFSQLETYREALASTSGLPLARQIHELTTNDDSAWKDKVFSAVVDAVEHFDDYALDPASAEALYLLTFIPGYARQFTRRLISNATLMRDINHQLGPSLTEDEATMLAAVTAHFKNESLNIESWSRPIPAISEENQIALAAIELSDIDNMATIQHLFRENRGTRVIEAWRTSRERLNDLVTEAAHASSLGSWELIDIGHGFEAFQDHAMYDALRTEHGIEFISQAKTGETAVILEDDPAQMKRYQEFIERRTRLTTGEALCFESPDGVLEIAADPNIKLFLLDIQNGDDMLAGVRLAREIIEIRLGVDNGDHAADDKTQVVIWTASAQLASVASEQLKPYLDQQGVDYMLQHGGGRSGRGKLKVEVRLKGWAYFAIRHVN